MQQKVINFKQIAQQLQHLAEDTVYSALSLKLKASREIL